MNASATDADALRDGLVVVHRASDAPDPTGLDGDCVNAIRFLSIDAVEKANSGHPGTPMGLAPLAYRLFTHHLRHDPATPDWPDRDRFVLSGGHASMLLYSSLHLSGYDLSIDDIKQFRQWGSRTPGHPEYGETPGVEITTGPLGQGFANAVGMAMAERMLAARFNAPGAAIVDHRTWCFCGEGDMMEGISSEAASLAGRLHLGLGKLTVFFDSNHVTLEGMANVEFCENVAERFDSYGWHVGVVDNVNDLDAVDRAIAEAEAETTRPSLITVHSHIGYGSPQQDTAAAHGAALGEESVAKTRETLGWTHPPFEVPDEVYAHWRGQVEERAAARAAWQDAFAQYTADQPERAAEFERVMAGRLPDGWRDALPEFEPGKSVATRVSGGQALNAFGAVLPELVGGSADVTPSTHTVITDSEDINCGDWAGRNIHFGIREQAMGAICNGMAAHGGLRPFCSTFFSFKDYMAEPVRLAAMMGLPVVFVFTHDSIGLGEDGPTHQPVEHLASLRAMPGLRVFRPADANESAQAWAEAIGKGGPSALVLSRQGLPTLDPAMLDVAGGASVVAPGDDAAIVATGSEVALALSARDLLAKQGIAARVVSMPCVENFRDRPADERDAILPPATPTLAVEAASPLGWHEFADDVLGLTRFGASAPGPIVQKELGFTAEAVAERLKTLLGKG
ncbi:MAG: transketolase [Alphaproteobacteria bacterium]|nr:transketolase [Alphaproteobacteria bacterium]